MKRCTDEQLVVFYKKGFPESFDILMERYGRYIDLTSKAFYSVGYTNKDFFQEGCIGLFYAVLRYNRSRGAFKPFAETNIKGRIVNSLKKATRMKFRLIDTAFSLYSPIGSDDSACCLLLEAVASDAADPEACFIEKEEELECKRRAKEALEPLSLMEREVVMGIVSGGSYKEVAKQIGISSKSVDNAFRRAKSKMREQMLLNTV